MVRLLMLILAVGQFFAQQAIMLDIVGRGQLPPSVRHLNGQEHKHDGPEECQQPGIKNDGNDQRLKDLVVQAPDTLTTPLKANLFEFPSAFESPGDFAGCERIDVFTHTRGCRVFRGGHVTVVPFVMFDEEVAIAHHCQHQFCHPAIKSFLLVTEFMAGVQRQTVDDPQRQCQRDEFERIQRMGCDPPARPDQSRIMHGHRQISKHAIISVSFKIRYGRFGGIGKILAKHSVQHRNRQIP